MLTRMDVSTAVRTRRMCRRFDAGREVPDGVVADLLDLASRAPSAGHSQGREFVALSTAEERSRFWTAAHGQAAGPGGGAAADPWLEGVSRAPVLVVALSDRDAYLDRYGEPDKGWSDRSLDRWPIPYWDTDTAMAVMILLLAAQEQGLGALFFGVPAGTHAEVREALLIPQRMRLVGVVALGHPDPTTPTPRSRSLRRGRRPLAEIVHRGRYGAH